MNSGVPSTMPVAVSLATSGPARRSLARPKSITTARKRGSPSSPVPSGTSMMFSGLRSRWMICSSCACWSPRHICTRSGIALGEGERPAPTLVVAERLALQVGHHEVDHALRLAHAAESGRRSGARAGWRWCASRRSRSTAAGSRDSRGRRILTATVGVGLGVLRPVDVRHAALAQPPTHLVAPVEQLPAQRGVAVELLGRDRRIPRYARP